MEQRFFFRKGERLCSRKIIDLLFKEKSNSIFIHPLRLTWIKAPLDTTFPAQVLITVSRKKFRNAVGRNRIKRQMREVYRKNKHILYSLLSSSGDKWAFSLSYVAENAEDTSKIENSFLQMLERLKDKLN